MHLNYRRYYLNKYYEKENNIKIKNWNLLTWNSFKVYINYLVIYFKSNLNKETY